MLNLKRLSTVLYVMPVAAVLMAQASLVAAAADECRPKPDSSAPMGSHWYYRVDRLNQRRCWYLGSENSPMRRANSLRRRELINRRTNTEAAQQSELNEKTDAEFVPRQKPAVLPGEQTRAELAPPQSDALPSAALVPHYVTSVSYTRPRAEKPSLRRGTDLDVVYLCGALAMALLVAGGSVQVVGRLHRRWRTALPKPKPTWSAKSMISTNDALSSKGLEIIAAKGKPLTRSDIASPQLTEAFAQFGRTKRFGVGSWGTPEFALGCPDDQQQHLL